MHEKDQLIERLNLVNATQHERMKMASLLQDSPESIALLIDLMTERSDEIGIKASWVLEWICRSDLTPILPYLSNFTACLSSLKIDSSIRAAAKICELLSEAGNSLTGTQLLLEPEIQSRIISACFDWLIGSCSTASKAYSMHCLYILGSSETWVHEELKAILQQQYGQESAGYKARARKVLNLMEKPR